MGFGDFVKGQFIDVIEHVDEEGKQLVYKYDRGDDEIKQGARLIVREGQCAVFVSKGRVADVFLPGSYRLDTGNLPLLSTLAALPTRFNSPIKSDLYFVNTTQFFNNRWQTKSPVIKRDAEMGIVRITAGGTFAFRVADAWTFMAEVFGARRLDLTEDIVEYLTSMVGESIAQCLGESRASVLDLAVHYRSLSDALTPYVNEKAAPLGLEVAEATVDTVGLPEAVEKLLDEQSGIGLAARDMDAFVQYQSARAIRDAARQPGGMAGIGAGLAVGRMVSDAITGSAGGAKPAAKAAGPAEPAASVADQLLKYKQLLDQGVLTQAEFDEVKAMLLKEAL